MCRYSTECITHIHIRLKRYHLSNYRLRFCVLFSYWRVFCFFGQMFFLDVSLRSVRSSPGIWPYHSTLLPSTYVDGYRDYFRVQFRFSIPGSEQRLRLVCNFSKTRICQFIYLQMYEVHLFIRRVIVSLCRASISVEIVLFRPLVHRVAFIAQPIRHRMIRTQFIVRVVITRFRNTACTCLV